MRNNLLAMILGLTLFGASATAADEALLSGYVIKLAEKTNLEEPQSINVGGLVIVVIRDSGSRPPQDVSVVASESLEKLGVVRGVAERRGRRPHGRRLQLASLQADQNRRRDRESRLHRKRRRRQTRRARVQADRRLRVIQSACGRHSYRSASIGSSREAFHAG